jgi:lysylphosphatidylglycerol synthetase-like protein (DUF2156 family)
MHYSMPRHLLGVGGSIALFFGVFAPIISAPVVENLNFFRNGQGDGVLVVILAALSLVFTLLRRFRALWATGLGALAVMLLTFANFQVKLSEMRAKVNSDLGENQFKGLADAAVQSVQLQWGWAVLVTGAGLLIGAAALSPTKLKPRLKVACAVGIGVVIIATTGNYVTDGYLSFLFSTLIGDLWPQARVEENPVVCATPRRAYR